MTESPALIGVLVVDDHPLLRDGLAALLGAQPDLRLLGEAADGEEAIACYQRLQPDVVLMDLQMPRLDGVEAIVRIRAMDPRARIIVLTTYRGDVRAVRALQAGASAYLLKDMLRHELVDTIRMVARKLLLDGRAFGKGAENQFFHGAILGNQLPPVKLDRPKAFTWPCGIVRAQWHKTNQSKLS